MQETSLEVMLGREVVARGTCAEILESINNESIGERGKELLSDTLRGVHHGIVVAYSTDEFKKLEGERALMLIATDSGVQVSCANVGSICEDDEFFKDAPELEDAEYWPILNDFFKERDMTKLCMAITLRVGQEKMKVWRKAISQCREHGTTPTLVICMNVKLLESNVDVSGLITVAELPIEPPDMTNVVEKVKDIVGDLVQHLAGDDDDDDDSDDGEALKTSVH